MSTVTYFTDKSQPCEVEKTLVMKNEAVIDFTLNPCISGDVVQALDIPAGAFVTAVVTNVITADANTVDVGDATDPNGWDASIDTSSTGVILGNGAYASAGGKYYASADTIDLTITNNMDTGKISVVASYFMLENL